MATTDTSKAPRRKIDPFASKSSPPITNQSLRDRLGALRNLWPFFKQVWATSPLLTATAIALRLTRALLPVATLYVGKLIIDEALRLVGLSQHFATLSDWFASGELNHLILLLGLEFLLAIFADVAGRIVALVDSLLSDRFNTDASVRLMQHAATLDLEDFEDSELQDRLDRARRLTMGRMTLLSQMFGQAQDVITVLSFAAGLALRAMVDPVIADRIGAGLHR
jgi:ATP-binding cassette subfamily B protein